MQNYSVIAAMRSGYTAGGKSPIVIRVLLGRKVVKTVATGIKVATAAWSEEKREVTKLEPNAMLHNAKIKKEVARIEADIMLKELNGVDLTDARVKTIVEGRDPGKDFYKFCQEWIPKKYSNKDTRRTYLSEITKAKQFREQLAFADIDYHFLTLYRQYMVHSLKNTDNTCWKTFKFINTMMIDALKIGGIIQDNPFKQFNRGRYKNPDKLGIELKDCDKIHLACITNADATVILKRVALKFLLMCYSGLRFQDAMRFDPAVHAITGEHLSIKTQKGGVVLNLKIYDRLRSVIDLIRENPLPAMTNREFNDWLKIVGQMSEVETELSAHVGRHTFGSILAEMEIPIEQAQKLMAHKDINSTKVYYHIKPKQLDRAADKLNGM